MLYDEAMGGGGDGQEKGKKKASDGRHDARNPDGFNGPRAQQRKRIQFHLIVELTSAAQSPLHHHLQTPLLTKKIF